MIERGDLLTGDLETAGNLAWRLMMLLALQNLAMPILLPPLILRTGVLSVVLAVCMGRARGNDFAMLPPAVRVGSRYSLLSAPMQRAIVNPKYSIGMVNKVLPGIIRQSFVQCCLSNAGIYGYGVL